MDKDHDDTLRLFQLENEALKDKLRDSNSVRPPCHSDCSASSLTLSTWFLALSSD